MMWTAFVVGLAGSLHCAGMCSPLVMAVTRLSARALTARLVYNAGRILTYGAMGAIVGTVGGLFDLTPLQRTISVVAGAILVLMGVSGSAFRIPLVTSVIARSTGRIKDLFGAVLRKKTPLSPLLLGILNGFLPCGLTYLALGYTITAPDAFSGFAYMIAFGAGTLPAMVGLPLIMNPLLSKLNISLSIVNAVLLITAGLLLVARNFIHIHVGHPLPLELHTVPLCGQ
jgi:sulfite exporter TauE/SafE